MENWTYHIYRLRVFLSFLIGALAGGSVFLIFGGDTVLSLMFPILFYCSNFLMVYFAITQLAIKYMEKIDSYDYQKMKLSSKVKIISQRGIHIAEFTLDNDKYEVKIQVESKFGMLGLEYDELNIDNIMIKPGKTYRVEIRSEQWVIASKVSKRNLVPISIDYFNLEDRFYLYKII